MGKLAKILIVVLLLLSIVSLVLGIMLFGQRDQLKFRAQKLEETATMIAGNLHMENFPADQLKDYKKMDQPRKRLEAYAAVKYEELQNTIADLEDTQQKLDQTVRDLQDTRQVLAQTQDKVTELEGEIEAKDIELAQTYSKVDQLEQDKSVLQEQIDNLNNQLVELEEQQKSLQDDYTVLKSDYERLLLELGERNPTATKMKGKTAAILLVNPYWNFVVIDIGAKEGLPPGADALVHREDRLIGKIRVTSVQDEMAIAEILPEWEQVPIREGDDVLF